MDGQRMSFQPSLLERVAISTFNLVNKFVPWYKMPSLLGALNLALLRVSSGAKICLTVILEANILVHRRVTLLNSAT